MAARHATLVAALAVTLAGLALPAPAPAQPATPPNVQAQINAHLRSYPGGVQTGPAEVSYDNGVFVMTFVRPESQPGTAGTADCPGGWFCFYDYINFGYPRGKLSDCGWQDLARWGWQNRTESVHYNQSSGSVAFLNHAAGVTHHTHDVAVFGVGTNPRTIADVSPNRNTADHVQRYC
ncbi:MAG TPA: hypothetical protein VF062_17240 [Candidatus Limnocylindrales bacterium]